MTDRLRNIAARLSLVLFGVLLLGAVEGVLRLVWTPPELNQGFATVMIDPFEHRGSKAVLRENFQAAFRPTSFDLKKPANLFRIFCLGGSTTLGYPYAAEYAWPASLERRLKALFPERQIEVVNLGGTSYGSARTLALLRGVLGYAPDLIVVATGDAEFVEDSFRAAVERRQGERSFVENLYLARILRGVLPRQKGGSVDAEDESLAGFLFAPAPTGTVYRVDSARRQDVYAALEKNLESMVALADKGGIPLFLTTLPANIADWPPDPDPAVPADPGERSRWQGLVAQGLTLATEGKDRPALDLYRQAADIWNLNARFSYDYARLLQKAGEGRAARQMYDQAVELDPVPVRATPAVNQMIRSATDGNAVLIDAARSFADSSPEGVTGETLILDYAHPTPQGHALLADRVLRGMLSHLDGWQVDPAKVEELARQELGFMATAVPESPAALSFALGQMFERKHLLARAEEMYRQAIAGELEGPFAQIRLAQLLALQGRHTEAYELVRALPQRYPRVTELFGLLGYLEEQRGREDDAIHWYQKAISSGEKSPELYFTLSRLLFSRQRYQESQGLLTEALTQYPQNCQLTGLLGRTYEVLAPTGPDAEALYREQLVQDPGCQVVAENLGIYLMNKARWTEASKVIETALRQPDPPAHHHLNLGYILLKGLNRPDAAAEHFARFLELRPEDVHLVPERFQSLPSPAEGGGR